MNQPRIWRFLATSAVVTALAALAILAAALIFQTSKIPIFLLWLTAEALLFCWVAPRESLRNAGLSVGVTLLLVAAVDISLRVGSKGDTTKHTFFGYPAGHGFGQPRSTPEQFRSKSTVIGTGEVVYDVTYTLDRHGFRYTETGGPGAETYLFFGDSFTFGEGLNEDQTIPAQFAKAMGGHVTPVNLGFGGFGPQDMLRLIETDGFVPAVTGPIKAAFYLAIADHSNRAVGAYPFNQGSPRYVFDSSGQLRFTGRYADRWEVRLLNQLDNWVGLPRLIAVSIRRHSAPDSERVELAAAIIARSVHLLRERHHVDLRVLLWDNPDTSDLEAALLRRQIGATRLSDVVGQLDRPGFRILPPYETHPSALADREIAQWLAREILASSKAIETGASN